MAHSLSWDEASQLRRFGGGVRVSDAHTFLHNLRLSLTHDRPVDGVWGFTEEAVDLTNGERFNWQGYLANHCDAWLELIFGDPPAASQGSSSRERRRRAKRIYKFEAGLGRTHQLRSERRQATAHRLRSLPQWRQAFLAPPRQGWRDGDMADRRRLASVGHC